MFFTLQFPFADLRPFLVDDPPTLFQRFSPGRPLEVEDRLLQKPFVRSMGKLRPRGYKPDFKLTKKQREGDAAPDRQESAPPNREYWDQAQDLWSEEYCFARTRRGLLFERLESHKLAGGKLFFPKAKVRAFHFSPYEEGELEWSPAMRVEVGINYKTRNALQANELMSALKAFVELPTRVPVHRGVDQEPTSPKRGGTGPDSSGQVSSEQKPLASITIEAKSADIKTKIQLDLPAESPGKDGNEKQRESRRNRAPLIDQFKALAALIVQATTPHMDEQIHPEMIAFGAPLLAVHFFPDELYSLPDNVVWLPAKVCQGEKIGYFPMRIRDMQIAVWLFELPGYGSDKQKVVAQRREVVRNYTIAIMRYWSELKAAAAVRRSVLDDRVGFSPRKELLEKYMTRCTSFLLKENWHGANLTVIRNIVAAYEDVVEDAQVRRMSAALEGFRRQIKERALNMFQQMGRSSIFVSYSHKDAQWLKQIQQALAGLRTQERVVYFDDTDLKPSETWFRKIIESIDTASIAVLLISDDFLESNFIATHELPRVKRLWQLHKLKVVPVWVNGKMPSAAWMKNIQFVKAGPAGPLAKADEAGQQAGMKELTRAVEELITERDSKSAGRTPAVRKRAVAS